MIGVVLGHDKWPWFAPVVSRDTCDRNQFERVRKRYRAQLLDAFRHADAPLGIRGIGLFLRLVDGRFKLARQPGLAVPPGASRLWGHR